MKPAPATNPHTEPEAKTSWADVARASAKLQAEPAAALQAARATEDSPAAKDSTFPGGNELQPGDSVQHEKFGRCTVHRIVSGFVHMAPVNGRVVKLSQNIVTFTPAFINDGRRVFSTSTRQ